MSRDTLTPIQLRHRNIPSSTAQDDEERRLEAIVNDFRSGRTDLGAFGDALHDHILRANDEANDQRRREEAVQSRQTEVTPAGHTILLMLACVFLMALVYCVWMFLGFKAAVREVLK